MMLVVCFGLLLPQSDAHAAAELEITPLTWNVIGLDSNNVSVGPNTFPVGARVCNVGDAAATDVVSSFVWDSGTDTYIALRSGSLTEFTTSNGFSVDSLAAGDCYDFYYEVAVTRTAASYDQTRRYHITASAQGIAEVSTPTPRELLVERLISQNRNSTLNMYLDGVLIPAGGSMNLLEGETYHIKLEGSTATNGYEQLESFINFSNTIFQIIAVETTYSADSSAYVDNPSDMLYADSCLWENDPNDPNYRSCLSVGKNGGSVTIDYTVKIVDGGGTGGSLSTLIYDFSGSSYHYNSDYFSANRYFDVIEPASVSIAKRFVPDSITSDGTSTMIITLTNPTGVTISGVNFSDDFPTSPDLLVAATPSVSYSGCGSGAFSPALSGGESSISFSNGTIGPNSSCTVKVNVTASTETDYLNTTNNLFINDTQDTGNTASDTLTVGSASATCTPDQTMAFWTVPNGTTANPPDLTGGAPTTKAADVTTAAASYNTGLGFGGSLIITNNGQNDSTSWEVYGFKDPGQYAQFEIDTSSYQDVVMSFYVANVTAPSSSGLRRLAVSYDSTGSGTFTEQLVVNDPGITFTQHTIDFTGLTNGSGTTRFRITGSGANNNTSGSGILLDTIKFTGCAVLDPPPTLSKAFSTDPIAVGGVTTLTFTIANTQTGNVALSNVQFSDELPDGLEVASSPNISTSGAGCTGLTFSPTAGSTTIDYTASAMTAGATCTASVDVTATGTGSFDNISGYISSTQSGENVSANGYGSDSLFAVSPPSIAKVFSPTTILTGDSSTLTFTLENPNLSTTLTGISFSDVLPADLSVADSSSSECGGTLTTTNATGEISLSGGSLAGDSSCTFSVSVTGLVGDSPTALAYDNLTGTVTSNEGGDGNTASATLYVKDPDPQLKLLKQIGLSNDGDTGTWYKFLNVDTLGTDVYYKITVENIGDVDLSSVSVSDPTLSDSPPGGLGINLSSCSWASLTTADPIQYCVVGPYTVNTAGTYENTASASGSYGATPISSDDSSATYGTPSITLVKSVTETYYTAENDPLHYSYTVENDGYVALEGPVTVSDDKASVTCPSLTTVGDNDNYLDIGETIVCSATYLVTSADITAQSVTNTASATVDGTTSNEDSATVDLSADLAISKDDSVTDVDAGDSLTYTIRVTNNGPASMTGAILSDASATGLDKTAVACSATPG